MTTLVLDLPPQVLERLTIAAAQRQQPVEDVASSLLSQNLLPTSYPSQDERDRVDHVLRESGMLVYLTDGLRSRVDPAIHHEDVVAALEHAGGQTLSEIVLEQRGA